jgi:hypothetical protein
MSATYQGVDGKVYRELIRPVRIEITRVEGLASECGIVQVCRGWTDANNTLRMNSRTAPTGGGYDKHDFKVVFADGLEYVGRYDLKHWRVQSPDLAGHVLGFVRWVANDRRAAEEMRPDQIDAARRLLENYDLEQGAVLA